MRLAALLLLVGWAGAAQAQDVRVRTAEHGDFTRVVFDFGRSQSWTLEREDGVLSIVTDRPTRFDLGDVYRRITRDRVTSIAQAGPGEVEITLGCDCTATEFDLANGGLVIDVSDDPPTPDAEPQPISRPTAPARVPRAPMILPGLLANALEGGPRALSRRQSVELAKARIEDQFSRGVAQGLVDARTPSPHGPVETRVAPSEGAAKPRYDMTDHIRVETQIDRDAPAGTSSDPVQECWPAARSDLASWGDPADPFSSAREAVAGLVDASGAPSAEGHAALARTFLYRSFGAEAGAVLRGAPEGTPDAAVLARMAGLMDGPAAAGVLSGQIDCASSAALFAFLDPMAGEPDDPTRIVGVFATYPPHLRAHLGPRLAERLADSDLAEPARVVRNLYTDTDAPMSQEKLFVDAKLSESEDVDLAPVVNARMPRAAEAMTFMIRSTLARGDTPDPEILLQADALAAETPDPARAKLEDAVLDSIIARGDFDTAFARADLLDRRRPGAQNGALNRLYRQIASLESDSDFLMIVGGQVDRVISDPDIRLEIASRLRDLNLPAMAERVIDASPQVPSREERVLRAELASDLGKARVASSYLAGLEGTEIDDLRARIDTVDLPQPRPAPATAGQPADPLPQRAESARVVEDSASLRAEIEALLAPTLPDR